MAHIFRKIRAFIDAFPQYRSIMKFYLKLRQIIRDGEKLQVAREGVSELVFQRWLKALEQRLEALLEWKNPNDTQREVIKKVRRQVAMTCQLRGISFHRFLKASLVCYIRTGRPMLLAEYESSLKPVAIAA